MSNRQIIGIATLACVACCIGPILGVLGAIAALGVLSAAFVGLVGLTVTIAAVIAIVVVRTRRRSCTTGNGETPVRITRRRLPAGKPPSVPVNAASADRA